MGLCVFCQTGRPTKEHVCPQWISRLIREYKPGDTFAAGAIPWPPPSDLNDEAFEDFIKSWTN
jgi:hypothetical protein